MPLLDQNVVFQAIPAARPGFIGPADAEREVQLRAAEHLLKWMLQQLSTIKPIIVVTESMDTILSRQFNLPLLNVHNTQVIKPQLRGQVRLIMPCKLRLGFGNVAPFGKTFSPPDIIFVNGMKLRQIKCDGLDPRINGQ